MSASRMQPTSSVCARAVLDFEDSDEIAKDGRVFASGFSMARLHARNLLLDLDRRGNLP